MIYNSLKIAWRSLQKNRLYTLISIVGLSIGVAATLLIFRIVSYESGFNKSFRHYDNIGRVVAVEQNEEGEGYNV